MSNTGMRRMLRICLVLLFLSCGRMTAHAAEMQAGEEDFTEIDRFLGRQGTGTGMIPFGEMVRRISEGEFTELFRELTENGKQRFLQEAGTDGKRTARMLILGLAGAVFAGFASVFSGSQVADAGFYVTYLLAFSLLSAAFLDGVSVTSELLEKITGFMRALVPSYLISVSFAGGTLTSAAACGWLLFSIECVEKILSGLLLPLVRVHMMLVFAGHLMRENVFSGMQDLLESGIRFGLRSLTGLILGFHLLQGMVTPYADAVRNDSLRRVLSLVPGLGTGAAAASQMVMGAGVLMKNSIGAAGVAVLAVLSLLPLLRLLLLCFCLRLSAAILEPISDRRMVRCIRAAGNGSSLLLQTAFSAVVLFAVSFGILSFSAGSLYPAG